MTREVAVLGVGSTNFLPISSDYSYKELMYEAAVKAYEDAGIDPRRDVDAIVTTAEDYWEGISIFDEYVPDQLGGVLKPVMTVSGDGLWGIATAYMLIKTGVFDVIVVESHSKVSDIVDPMSVWKIALDPHYHRPLIDNLHVFAGLEMNKFIEEFDVARESISSIVSKNRYYALYNPVASYGAKVDIKEVSESKIISYPLRSYDISKYSDGAVVVVLSTKEYAKKHLAEPIVIEGIGWISDSPYIEEWDLSVPTSVRLAGERAYTMAGISYPFQEIDFAEIDDRYSYRELQNLVALDLVNGYSIDELVYEGINTLDGDMPTNPSGGYLGIGYPLEAGGLLKFYSAVKQLRYEAGKLQVEDCERGLVMTRREFPSPSSAVVVIGR